VSTRQETPIAQAVPRRLRDRESTQSDQLIEATCRKLQARLDELQEQVVEFNLLRITKLGLESRLPRFADQPRSKAERALASICAEPGSTTQEIADDSGIVIASLYPVLRTLTDQGLAHRTSRHWYPGPREGVYTNVLDFDRI
jgi:predicted Rossmann fold nucleotide-binding protein DprA/Smf involved in DNA uptake